MNPTTSGVKYFSYTTFSLTYETAKWDVSTSSASHCGKPSSKFKKNLAFNFSMPAA